MALSLPLLPLTNVGTDTERRGQIQSLTERFVPHTVYSLVIATIG